MTRHYLVGDLSRLLGRLQAAAPDAARARQVARLRQETEARAPEELGPVAHRALDLTEVMCWESLTHCDLDAFEEQAALSAELYELGLCGGLLDGG
jgi:hypothetical protein